MTIGQIIFDALAWCRYFAVNESIGRTEVKPIFYEAFQYVYNEAVVSHTEYFIKSMSITGSSISLPVDFRKCVAIVVDDAACSAGYAKLVPREQWSVRQSNARTKGTTADPLARLDAASIVLSGSVTAGKMYYVRNYSETDLATESQDVTLFLPLVFQPLLLSKMQELIRVRHFRTSGDPSENERQTAIMRMGAKNMKRSLKPLEVIEGITEKPQSIVAGGI